MLASRHRHRSDCQESSFGRYPNSKSKLNKVALLPVWISRVRASISPRHLLLKIWRKWLEQRGLEISAQSALSSQFSMLFKYLNGLCWCSHGSGIYIKVCFHLVALVFIALNHLPEGNCSNSEMGPQRCCKLFQGSAICKCPWGKGELLMILMCSWWTKPWCRYATTQHTSPWTLQAPFISSSSSELSFFSTVSSEDGNGAVPS